jgi:hypothetical protein
MSEPVTHRRNPVRGGTVIWGIILIIIAVGAYATTLIDFTVLGSHFVILAVIGLGVLLVFAAIIGAVLRAFRRVDTTPAEQPPAE